jgi:hypothetical protein
MSFCEVSTANLELKYVDIFFVERDLEDCVGKKYLNIKLGHNNKILIVIYVSVCGNKMPTRCNRCF